MFCVHSTFIFVRFCSHFLTFPLLSTLLTPFLQSYLVALAVGNLSSRRVGPRSHIWCEPELVDAAAAELVDTERFISIGESLMGPYEWGTYDVLVLPSSFPYGGMENPCLTFVSPSIIAGDRSLVSVVAHEVAHSWTGNLVTARTWEHFWLNEGFTVYLERRILGEMFGEKARQFDAILGWKDLEDAVARQPAPLTALVPSLAGGVDPDDAFSSVPYEKGFAFFYHVETLVGGPRAMDPFLRAYAAAFRHKSIATDDLRALLEQHFPAKTLESIDWATWVNAPGMPPVKHAYDDSLAKAAGDLAEAWRSAGDRPSGADQWESFSTDQRVYMLQRLDEAEPRLGHVVIEKLESAYGLNAVRNSEVRFNWQKLALHSGWTPVFPHVVDFITSIGRMKFVIPLYLYAYWCIYVLLTW